MKKPLFIITGLLACILSGCDPSYYYYFDIKNDTQSEVTVKVGSHESTVIPPGKKKMLYSDSTLGATDPFEYIVLYNLQVMINDKLISDNFWQREYWEEKRDDTYHFTYTLTLTDELLENLKQPLN